MERRRKAQKTPVKEGKSASTKKPEFFFTKLLQANGSLIPSASFSVAAVRKKQKLDEGR
jgi:hypothetical protein